MASTIEDNCHSIIAIGYRVKHSQSNLVFGAKPYSHERWTGLLEIGTYSAEVRRFLVFWAPILFEFL